MAVLDLKNVTKTFGRLVAVDNVSITVDSGEILSLLGPSGCGKTTTLRLISGFEKPNNGSISILGKEVTGKRPYERNVGLLFQDYALFPHMTVAQNVAYGLKQRKYGKDKIAKRVDEMLTLVKLLNFKNRYPAQLSGGQQQRVALARALAINPAVVLLDEPLSALDAKLRQQLRFELKEILNAVGATTIVVTHDQEEAMSLGDNVIVMSRGKIIQEGHPTEIYADPKTKFVAEFIGRSNWFSGIIQDSVSSDVVKFKTSEGVIIRVAWSSGDPAGSGDYEICVRPERICILREGKTAKSGIEINHLIGKIKDVAHLGADIQLVVQIQGGRELLVTEQYVGQDLEQKGENVALEFRPEDCIIVPADS